MANKPDMLFWVPDNDTAKIVDPGGSKKSNGFIYKEKPAFQFVNYLFNRIYLWLKGLQGSYSQVVVGSSSQIAAGSATHTINQLNNTVVAAGSRVMVLEGTHILTGNLALSNINCTFSMENGGAIIDLDNTYKLTLSGARTLASLKFINAPNATDVVTLSGASSNAILFDISPLNVTGSATAVITCVGSSPSVKVGSIIVPAIVGALTDGAAIAWDLAIKEIATVTLGGNRTLSNPSNKRVGRFTLIVTQDGTGGRTLAFGTDYKGQTPYINTTAGAVTVIDFVCDGTSLYFRADVLDTDNTLAGDSDIREASQKAVKAFVEAYVSANNGRHDYILVRDQKAQNADGGTFTAGAWRTRDITTEVSDTGNNCSVGSNQITLEAGTYECDISAPATTVAGHQARLQNITDGTTTLLGTSEYISTTVQVTTRSIVKGRFTIATAKTFEVQHYCTVTKATEGFGKRQADSTMQIYTVAEFRKILS